MNLESAVKYHFAKTTSISDAPSSTSPDRLTVTDVMGAFGYCQSKESFGFSAFSGKMEISQNDKVKAIQLLTRHALNHCDKVPALRKLDMNVKRKVMQILAKFAYADYCRSASSVTECVKCNGSGFKVKTIKAKKVFGKEVRIIDDTESCTCDKCNGKGYVSCACNDCKGRGMAIDRETLRLTGEAVSRPCKRCSGRGYERIPASKAFQSVSHLGVTIDQWKRSVSKFYESLVVECEKGESNADYILKKVTN